MYLGEKICKLRTEKNMSQGELADALGVSRQSISKWETSSAIPELDKLIKLSEIFEVSLDELVLDKKLAEETATPNPEIVYRDRAQDRSVQKTVGAVLLCFSAFIWMVMSILYGIITGLILAAPFSLCGLICLFIRKNAGLWCAWVIYLLTDIYLRKATGINWQYVFIPYLYTGNRTPQLITAWCLWAAFAALVIITALLTKKNSPCSVRKDLTAAILGWAVYVITQLALLRPIFNAIAAAADYGYYANLYTVVSWVSCILLSVAIIFTLRLIIGFLKSISSKTSPNKEAYR